MSFVPLALIVDDPLAPAVLAAWQALALNIDDETAAEQLASLLTCSVSSAQDTLNRCKVAGLVMDGAVSEIAERWVETTIANKMKPREKRTSAPRPR